MVKENEKVKVQRNKKNTKDLKLEKRNLTEQDKRILMLGKLKGEHICINCYNTVAHGYMDELNISKCDKCRMWWRVNDDGDRVAFIVGEHET